MHRIGGNGFCGCSRRTLLLILQDRAAELGVRLVDSAPRSTHEGDCRRRATSWWSPTASTAASASGIADHFQPDVDLRPNKFAWMGSTRPLDAFTFVFQETEWGPFIAHAYQYEPDRSTWVFETDPETFERAGLGDDERGAKPPPLMERIFGWFLDGHPILTNRSHLAQLPDDPQRSAGSRDNMVLLGDAKATAHFSIGSGTKLAMEDAIALYEALAARRDVDGRAGALRIERGARKSRRPSTPPTSRSSGSSTSPASGTSTRSSSPSA